jgi:hypothetical protein
MPGVSPLRRFFTLLSLAILIVLAGCGGSSLSSSSTSGSSTAGSSGGTSNILSIAVNGGPTASELNGSVYANAAFASATICAPGSATNCVTVDNLLVDTGSTGLRVLQSAVASLNLPAVDASNGSSAYDCINFVDNSYLWGPVQKADVTLGGETATSLPIQVISTANTGIPSTCSNGSTANQNAESSLGANGILGVGAEPTDCYFDGSSACSRNSGLASAPYPAYYTCSGSTCSPAFISAANQVTNPVVLFPTDNNGVIVELPAVSGNAASINGSLIFGIGTESNNQLPGTATVFTLTCDEFTTQFANSTYGVRNATTCAGAGSFIDSGSNGLYFPNATGIPACPSNSDAGDISSFYCPPSSESFSATNSGANGTSKTTSFNVANAETLFSSTATASDAALPGLAGINPAGFGFDWGLPFFYGVNVYTSIDGQSVPGAPAAPWWAY